MEPREGVLIARAGEALVCPTCRIDLLVFQIDWTDRPGRVTGEGGEIPLGLTAAATARPAAGGGWLLNCRECGNFPHRQVTSSGSFNNGTGQRLFIRSGSWIGWRGLGE